MFLLETGLNLSRKIKTLPSQMLASLNYLKNNFENMRMKMNAWNSTALISQCLHLRNTQFSFYFSTAFFVPVYWQGRSQYLLAEWTVLKGSDFQLNFSVLPLPKRYVAGTLKAHDSELGQVFWNDIGILNCIQISYVTVFGNITVTWLEEVSIPVHHF